MSELVHALVIATHFAAISSFTFGCGINLEVDMEGGHTLRPPSFTDSAVTDEDGLSNNNYSEVSFLLSVKHHIAVQSKPCSFMWPLNVFTPDVV